MTIEQNKSLARYNSFGFDVQAEYFTAVDSVDALDNAIRWCNTRKLPFLILGGGSNIVITRDIKGLVIHMANRGIRISSQQQSVSVRVAAGEVWHELVLNTLQQDIFGLENLALIPGCAGAAPIQNIGAYGVEICNYLDSVEVYDTRNHQQRTLTTAECQFAYRHSLFKTEAGRHYVVTGVNLNLSTVDAPTLTYRALTDQLQAKKIEQPSAQQVFDTVCEIRRAKLPDPASIGNAGSFFKNPVVDRQLFDKLKSTYPDMPGYQERGSSKYKIPAAWLIDRAGWKGKRFDQVGVHSAQALVLVNHGGGNGQQIAILADDIRQDILDKYGVHLEREPTLYE